MVKIIHDQINGLTKDSAVDCFQVRSVSHERFVKKIGQTLQSTMDDIKVALAKVLSIEIE